MSAIGSILATTAAVDHNSTTTAPYYGPWYEQFGPLQYFEVFYLSIVVVLGTIGNLTVIFSIVFEHRVHAHGNIFVINLAVADLLVTGFVVPTVIANVVKTTNSLDATLCTIVGYTVTVTCTCSLSNLMLIAINRYWAVVHNKTYAKHFSRKRVYVMVFMSWFTSNLVSMPTLVGWSSVDYDFKMMVCSWSDTRSLSYTYFLTLFAIFVPLLMIGFCYYKLFITVRSSGRWVRSLSASSGACNSEQNRRSERKERNLLQTLATTVAFFCICWLPYGLAIMINAKAIPAQAKKVFGWLGLSNSAVNFVIYGAMNPVFRRGYQNLYVLIFTCKRAKGVSSTGLHASQHSDSFYKSRRKSSSPNNPNSRLAVHRQSLLIARNTLPQNYYSDTRTTPMGTPQLTRNNNGNHLSCVRTPTSTESNAESTEPAPKPIVVKKPVPSSIGAFKRPNSLLRRERKSQTSKVANAELNREARLKRNSLMLLQIQTSDDEEGSPIIHRRTQSEVPNGKPPQLKPVSHQLSSSENHLSTAAPLISGQQDSRLDVVASVGSNQANTQVPPERRESSV